MYSGEKLRVVAGIEEEMARTVTHVEEEENGGCRIGGRK